MRSSVCALLAVGLLLGGASSVFAEGLAGTIGDKRYPIQFPMGETDQCAKAYKDYVNVNSHAAYAQTPSAFPAEGFFCAASVGRTTAEAEKEALENCRSLFKRYKMSVTKNCQIYASK